jgi:hypothetical protein
VKAELMDSEEESGEETSGPNQSGKKRKMLFIYLLITELVEQVVHLQFA